LQGPAAKRLRHKTAVHIFNGTSCTSCIKSTSDSIPRIYFDSFWLEHAAADDPAFFFPFLFLKIIVHFKLHPMTSQTGKHTYDLWFMQNHLSDDYGSFTCDICGREFYHSPSIIYFDSVPKYNCCCGVCVNRIIAKDWREMPYRT
jgi:hypothetical protein